MPPLSIIDAIRDWCVIHLRRQNLVVFVTYPAKAGTRDFVDDSLTDFFHVRRTGELSGGGSFFSAEKETMSETDVDLYRPFRVGYHDLVRKLREMQMPPETMLRCAFGRVPLYDIPLPTTQ
jgi:hypothetical protein